MTHNIGANKTLALLVLRQPGLTNYKDTNEARLGSAASRGAHADFLAG